MPLIPGPFRRVQVTLLYKSGGLKSSHSNVTEPHLHPAVISQGGAEGLEDVPLGCAPTWTSGEGEGLAQQHSSRAPPAPASPPPHATAHLPGKPTQEGRSLSSHMGSRSWGCWPTGIPGPGRLAHFVLPRFCIHLSDAASKKIYYPKFQLLMGR